MSSPAPHRGMPAYAEGPVRQQKDLFVHNTTHGPAAAPNCTLWRTASMASTPLQPIAPPSSWPSPDKPEAQAKVSRPRATGAFHDHLSRHERRRGLRVWRPRQL